MPTGVYPRKPKAPKAEAPAKPSIPTTQGLTGVLADLIRERDKLNVAIEVLHGIVARQGAAVGGR